VELRSFFVACLCWETAPLLIDGTGRFVSNLSALSHTGGEKKLHRIVENMRMDNCLAILPNDEGCAASHGNVGSGINQPKDTGVYIGRTRLIV
jgi:hypothetical protein